MIEVVNYTNKEVEETLESLVEKSYQEVRTYLRNLPESIDIYFDGEDRVIPEVGVGGFAYSHTTMTLAVQKDFPDKALQQAELRSTVFHESFHISQHFTYEDGQQNALYSAIYEGCATVFEREYAQGISLYGDYSAHSEAELEGWLKRLIDVGESYSEDEGVWHEWAFYNHELNQRWILYKTGTWLVDRILKETGLDIVDFQDKTAEEIYALSTS